jgi:hypothetical protein
MTGSAKQKALILLGLVMLIMVMIAASLPQVELQPGMPLPRLENNQLVVAPTEKEPLMAVSVSEFVKVILALILTGTLLFILYKLYKRIKNIDWHHLFSYIRPIMVILLMMVSILSIMLMLLSTSQSSGLLELPAPVVTPILTSPLGPVPALLLWLVGIGLLAASILLGIWLLGSTSKRATTIDLLGLEAEKAWQALKTGLDLKDVIVQCYRQMSLALEKEQKIEREDSMTTREFEKLLEAAGVPHDPIHQLTQLFEAVRYGSWQPNPGDEQKAIHCLEAIILYSRSTKKTN